MFSFLAKIFYHDCLLNEDKLDFILFVPVSTLPFWMHSHFTVNYYWRVFPPPNLKQPSALHCTLPDCLTISTARWTFILHPGTHAKKNTDHQSVPYSSWWHPTKTLAQPIHNGAMSRVPIPRRSSLSLAEHEAEPRVDGRTLPYLQLITRIPLVRFPRKIVRSHNDWVGGGHWAGIAEELLRSRESSRRRAISLRSV